MGMRSKAPSACNVVIVEDTQGTKVHLFRVVPPGETETVVRVQPPVIGMAALGRPVKNKLDLSISRTVHGAGIFWKQDNGGHHGGLREKGESR